MPAKDVTQSTTQQFLDIYDISNDVVILKNGASSIILTVNAINFGLLAEEEQDAVMYQYAALLNSLNFPIQVVVRSQTKDASSYLQLIKDREDQTVERVKKDWIRRYREFVSNLIYERNVLDKKFYVVIPASYLEMGLTTAQNVFSSFKESTIQHLEKSVVLEKALTILEPRRDHIISQFARIGLMAHQLKTQEIIQLFYTSYNPEAAEGQQITDTKSYTTPLVQAQIRGVIMNDQPLGAVPTIEPVNSDPMTTPPQTPPGQVPTTQPVAEPVVPTPPTPTPEPITPPTPAMPTPTMPTPSMTAPTPTPAMPEPTMSVPPTPTTGTNPSIIESPVTTTPVSAAGAPAPAATVSPIQPVSTALPTPPPSAPLTAPVSTPTMSIPTPTPPAAPVVAEKKPEAEMQAVIDSTIQELSTPATPAADEEPATPDLAGVAPVIPVKPS